MKNGRAHKNYIIYVKKALHKEKSKRYRTIQAFYEAWLTNIE